MSAVDHPNLASDGASATLADRVLHAIQTAIVQGDLAPGLKLNEPELAQRYGISRGPLREAIRRLEARRLVAITPHSGARVVSLSGPQLLAIYQTREALEGMAARIAAAVATHEQLDELYALLDQHELTIETDARAQYYQEEGDLDFHYRLVQCAGNDVLAGVLLDDLYQLMRMYRFKFSTQQGRPVRALEEHRRIVEAIAEHDGDLAEMLMRRHIGAARRWLDTHRLTFTDAAQPTKTTGDTLS